LNQVEKAKVHSQVVGAVRSAAFTPLQRAKTWSFEMVRRAPAYSGLKRRLRRVIPHKSKPLPADESLWDCSQTLIKM
jgi:hypothetical protein